MITLLPKYCRIYILIVILMQEEHLALYSTSLLIHNIKRTKCLQYTTVEISGSTQCLSYRKQEEFR